jgi:hypothetical protein
MKDAEKRGGSSREKIARSLVAEKMKIDEARFRKYVKISEVVYRSLFDTHGSRLETLVRSFVDSKSSSSSPSDPKKKTEEEECEIERDEKDEDEVGRPAFGKMDVPELKRKDIVLEFLRAPVPECAERECVNEEFCVSKQQFHQLWWKDGLLFEKAWGVSVDFASGRITDKRGNVFGGFALREFLYPEAEERRKLDFSLAMADFLNGRSVVEENSISSVSAARDEENEEEEDYDRDGRFSAKRTKKNGDAADVKFRNWLAETTAKVNPQMRGHCILCLVRLISELTHIFCGASIVSNPSALVSVQHHKNVFGKVGEYKVGTEINRGSNLGLRGTVLEYRVDNYQPGRAKVHYKTIEEDRSFGSSARNDDEGHGRYVLVDKTAEVLQWFEIDAIVCKAEDGLETSKSCT